MSRHRAPGLPRLASYDVDSAPAHCAGGQSCLHSHRGEPSLPVFAQLDEPVLRCDRRGSHGAHDVTADGGDFRCPGRVAAHLPAPELTKRVARAREAIGGAR